MIWAQGFLVGFLVGICGMVFIFFVVQKKPVAAPSGSQVKDGRPHTDDSAAASIGHDRGIEVFDD